MMGRIVCFESMILPTLILPALRLLELPIARGTVRFETFWSESIEAETAEARVNRGNGESDGLKSNRLLTFRPTKIGPRSRFHLCGPNGLALRALGLLSTFVLRASTPLPQR